jgi:hypothetical protein
MAPPDGLGGGAGLEAYLQGILDNATNAREVRVGFLEDATYPDGKNVATIAAIQEFGAPSAGIPPRPFFRSMIADKSPQWGTILGALLDTHGYDAAQALALMGEGISGQLRQSIVDTVAPPLSPITLLLRQMRADDPDLVVTGKVVGEAAKRVAKGESASDVSTKPLVDSGVMLGSVDYEVS